MDQKQAGTHLTMSGPAVYRITVMGALDAAWLNNLADMQVSVIYSDDGQKQAILVGRLADQAALSSVLNVLYELNLPVVSVECLANG